MNVQINQKLIEDSAKIDVGVRSLQGKIVNVIDQYTDKNIDHQGVLDKYVNELAEIKISLKDLYRQQKDFNTLLSTAEKEVSTIETDVKSLMNG